MYDLIKFRDEMTDFMNDFWNNDVFHTKELVPKSNNNYPKSDVTVLDDKIVMELAIPGLTKDDVELSYKDGYLTVSGSKVESKYNGDKHLKELKRSSFKRAWAVSDLYDVQQADAKLENGILTLEIPKRVESPPKVLNIEVK